MLVFVLFFGLFFFLGGGGSSWKKRKYAVILFPTPPPFAILFSCMLVVTVVFLWKQLLLSLWSFSGNSCCCHCCLSLETAAGNGLCCWLSHETCARNRYVAVNFPMEHVLEIVGLGFKNHFALFTMVNLNTGILLCDVFFFFVAQRDCFYECACLCFGHAVSLRATG